MKRSKFLGQHFLKNLRPVEMMLTAAKKEPAVDVILEIGPGKGMLTRALCQNFSKVIAVEKDRRLAEELKRNLEMEKIRNYEVIIGDILKTDFLKAIGKNSYAVIANIPYYLTSRLVRTFLEARRQPAYMILMVQKEVAERIVARPPKMNLLALAVQSYGQPGIIGYVSKKEFEPQPEVDSAVIKISGISRSFFIERRISEKNFFTLARAGFSQKRKRISNTLAKFFGGKKAAEEKIKKAGLLSSARPQELARDEWAKILLA